MKVQLFFASALFLTACYEAPTHKRKSLGSLADYNSKVAAEAKAQEEADAQAPAAGGAADIAPAAGGAADVAPAAGGGGGFAAPVPAGDNVVDDGGAGADAGGGAGVGDTGDGGLALDGKALFDANCARCHGAGAAKKGRSALQIANAIQFVSAMSPLKGKYEGGADNAELKAISDYLDTL